VNIEFSIFTLSLRYGGFFVFTANRTALTFVSIFALALALSPGISRANSIATASTVDTQDGPFAGRTIAGMSVMNSPCAYGDHYHYKLNSEGELSTEGPIFCGKVKAGGGEEVCRLSPELTCVSRTALSGNAGVPYGVDGNGVKVGDKTYPWANPQEATALFPAIQARAKAKCDEVLFWQAKDKEHNKITSEPSRAQAQASCKQTLEQICGSGGKLSNGKDVSILCHP
jgi:hypothetical protein